MKLTPDLISSYQNAKPFKYLVIDDFFPEIIAKNILFLFPEADEKFYSYDNLLEKKRATDKLELMPFFIQDVVLNLNASHMVTALENLTGIHGLITDPHLRGGGLHIIEKDGFLDLHVDFSHNKRLNLYRRLNVLIYFNEDWKEGDGGELELWSSDLSEHVSIAPIFNRLVVFETTSDTYHGHPNKWAKEKSRKSIAAYYYTVEKPEKVNLKSTTFVARPGDVDTPEKKELRLVRAQGRLSSNV